MYVLQNLEIDICKGPKTLQNSEIGAKPAPEHRFKDRNVDLRRITFEDVACDVSYSCCLLEFIFLFLVYTISRTVEVNVPADTSSRRIPNNSVSVDSLTLREAGAPICPPIIEATANSNTIAQST